ncbi:MAG: chaperone modulator CbpM [Candidatus Syntropharchaeia archaeon]
MKKKYSILRIEFEDEPVISLEEVSRRCGLHPSIIEHYVRMELISPVENTGYLFKESVVDKIKRIQRLKRDLGVNLIGAGIILDLLDEIERLKREISYLKRRW